MPDDALTLQQTYRPRTDYSPAGGSITTTTVATRTHPRVLESSIMLRADIPEDEKFTAAAQQLTAKSLKILEAIKRNKYTLKLKCDSIILCRDGVLINVFHCNRDVTIFAPSRRLA
jgi:hypothetical protein